VLATSSGQTELVKAREGRENFYTVKETEDEDTKLKKRVK